jgi:hypothetical protein
MNCQDCGVSYSRRPVEQILQEDGYTAEVDYYDICDRCIDLEFEEPIDPASNVSLMPGDL